MRYATTLKTRPSVYVYYRVKISACKDILWCYISNRYCTIVLMLNISHITKHLFRGKIAKKPIDDREKFDERISPNMRALRLSVSMADTLSSMGVSVRDIVEMCIDVTSRYCKRPVQFDIISNLIIASQDRGNDREPLTIMRTTARKQPNNMLVQAIQELIYDIRHKDISLDDAEERYAAIIQVSHGFPEWLRIGGGAFIGAGVAMLFTGSFAVIAISFIVAGIVSHLMHLMSVRDFPAFFAQVLSALLTTLTAAAVTWLGVEGVVPVFADINPTLIIIGGIILLVAGLAIVGAVQDAIDEFYVTASGRLLRVVIMTMGIVGGVLGGLYVAKEAGIYISLNTTPPPLRDVIWQYIGAAMISGGYALNMQTRTTGIIAATGIGALAWFITIAASGFEINNIVANGIAAVTVGAIAGGIARYVKTPSTALITAGIVPLVPGLALYNGLMQLVGNPAINTTSIDSAVMTLLEATTIALTIAAGASLGNIIIRPILARIHRKN